MNFITKYAFLLFLCFFVVGAQNQVVIENKERLSLAKDGKEEKNIEKSTLSKKQIILCDGLIGWIIQKYDLDKKIAYELELDEGVKIPLITQETVLNLISFGVFWTILATISKTDADQMPIMDQKIVYTGILALSGMCGVAKQAAGSLVNIPYNWMLHKVPTEGSYWIFKKSFQIAVKTLNNVSMLVAIPIIDTITRRCIKKIT